MVEATQTENPKRKIYTSTRKAFNTVGSSSAGNIVVEAIEGLNLSDEFKSDQLSAIKSLNPLLLLAK